MKQQLEEVYKILYTINTSGKDTVNMAYCLQILYNILKEDE